MTQPEDSTPATPPRSDARSSNRLRTRLARLARQAWRWEVGVWSSLWRFAARRPRAPKGGVAFAYHAPIRSILVIFIVLSAVEIPILDLIARPWPVIRITLLAAGIWGLMWMIGLLLGFITRPHTVAPGGIRVQEGPQLGLELSWSDIHSVAIVADVAHPPPKPPRFTSSDRGRILHLRVQNETNLEIVLKHPVEVRLPDATETARIVRFWADEPRAMLEAARPHLEGASASHAAQS
ncbi:hypothetical protein GCM10009786_06460 [Leucobacter alluvii]|uniref:PH domain-containing protein n=1 Tax=Leucobacter alluvii TaxID=340321 RepID=A0ABN3B4X2_9MICO